MYSEKKTFCLLTYLLEKIKYIRLYNLCFWVLPVRTHAICQDLGDPDLRFKKKQWRENWTVSV